MGYCQCYFSTGEVIRWTIVILHLPKMNKRDIRHQCYFSTGEEIRCTIVVIVYLLITESTHFSIPETQAFKGLQNNLILKKCKMTQTNNISMKCGTALDRMDQIHQRGNVGSNIAVRTQEHQLGNNIILFELYRRERTFNSKKVTFPFGIY